MMFAPNLVRRWAPLLGLVVGLLAVYGVTLRTEPFFDDVNLFDDVSRWQFVPYVIGGKRFLSYAAFHLVDAVAPGSVLAQRLFNLGLHVVNVLLLHALVRSVLRWEASRESLPSWWTSAAVAWFAVSPVALYAVAYLQQRSIVMATTFALLSYLFFVSSLERSRALLLRGLFMLLAVAAYVAAVFSKEQAITAAAGFGMLYLVHRASQRPDGRALDLRAFLVLVALLLAAATLVWFVFRGALWAYFVHGESQVPPWILESLAQITDRPSGLLWWLSILLEAKAFFFYLYVWLVPDVWRMSIDLRPALSVNPYDAIGIVAFVGYLLVLIGSWGYLARGRDAAKRWLALGLAWFATSFLIEFTVYRILDPVVLYRSYWWATGLPFVAVGGLAWIRHRWPAFAACWLGPVVAVYLAIVFLAAVWHAQTFRSPLALWDQAVKALPATAWSDPRHYAAWRPLLNRGIARLKEGDATGALQDFEQARRLNGPPGVTEYYLALSRKAAGDLAGAWREVRAALQASIDPSFRASRTNLVALAIDLASDVGQYDESLRLAESSFGSDLARLPRRLDDSAVTTVLRAYARSLIRLDRPAEAADLLTRWSAVGELPRELKILWIDALGRAGRFEEAERRLAAFGPAVEEDAQLLSLRALLSARQGRTEAALSDARKAQQLAPDNAQVRRLLEILQRQTSRP
jgi:tetratricopeptide (TPR) repeat protein